MPRKDVTSILRGGLIVVDVVVFPKEDLDRLLISGNLFQVSSKSIGKSSGDRIHSKSIVDQVASCFVSCKLKLVLGVARNLVLVAIEKVLCVVDVVSSLLQCCRLVGLWVSLEHLLDVDLVIIADVILALLVDGYDVVAALCEDDAHDHQIGIRMVKSKSIGRASHHAITVVKPFCEDCRAHLSQRSVRQEGRT